MSRCSLFIDLKNKPIPAGIHKFGCRLLSGAFKTPTVWQCDRDVCEWDSSFGVDRVSLHTRKVLRHGPYLFVLNAILHFPFLKVVQGFSIEMAKKFRRWHWIAHDTDLQPLSLGLHTTQFLRIWFRVVLYWILRLQISRCKRYEKSQTNVKASVNWLYYNFVCTDSYITVYNYYNGRIIHRWSTRSHPMKYFIKFLLVAFRFYHLWYFQIWRFWK